MHRHAYILHREDYCHTSLYRHGKESMARIPTHGLTSPFSGSSFSFFLYILSAFWLTVLHTRFSGLSISRTALRCRVMLIMIWYTIVWPARGYIVTFKFRPCLLASPDADQEHLLPFNPFRPGWEATTAAAKNRPFDFWTMNFKSLIIDSIIINICCIIQYDLTRRCSTVTEFNLRAIDLTT